MGADGTVLRRTSLVLPGPRFKRGQEEKGKGRTKKQEADETRGGGEKRYV